MTTHLDQPPSLKDAAAAREVDTAFDGSAKTMPLMSGGASLPEVDEFESEPIKNSRSILNQSTLLILLMLGVAAILIYTMRLSQGEIRSAESTIEAEAKIDQALARLTKSRALPQDDPLRHGNLDELFRDTDLIISMFSSDLTSHQVPIEYLQRNPFILTLALTDPTADMQPVALQNDGKRKKLQQRMEELNKELAGLKLQTVILGNVNVAVINDDLFQETHTVGSFTVTKISKMSVQLEADDKTFTLTMGQ